MNTAEEINSASEKEVKVETDKSRPVRLLIKNLLRYPNIKKRLAEYLPNVFFDYSDHPLDIDGTAINSIFTFFKKTSGRKASCVLKAEFKERKANSFLFTAKGYNVFRIRDFDRGYAHEYNITEKTLSETLLLQVDFLAHDVYRIRLSGSTEAPKNDTPMLVGDIVDPSLTVDFEEKEDRYRISTGAITLNIYKNNFRITIQDPEGNLVTESGGKTKAEFPTAMDSFPLGFVEDVRGKRRYGVESFVLYPGEAVYGLGEQFGPLNKVGSHVGLWHYEGLGNTSGRIYKNIPFFMSTQGYGVFVNESAPITYWVGSREYCKNQVAIEGDLIDYFFFYGPSFQSILNRYTDLTGKASVPPKWTFGTWISRITYFSQKQVMKVAKKLREMRFPADVIHIDTGWFNTDWLCDWRFNRERFPDPAGMFKEAAEMGFKISLWQLPYVMDDTELYKEAKRKGVLAKNNGPFLFLFRYPAHPIDFSKPEAVEWYQEQLKRLLEMGASAIKADFGEGIEPTMQFARYNGRKMHNLYPLLYNKAAFEITEQVKGRGAIWARSGYAGSQRYPIHWSGDNSANYENMLCSLRGGLSLGLCGFSFWSQDTGGFMGTPTDELYIRWTQLSIFQSHIRYHGAPPKFREPWNYEEKTQNIVRHFLELRYRLIPYLYTEAHHAAKSGLPMLRALVLDFQDDRTVYNIEDQFMCGRNLLVAPILTERNRRSVYLPAGTWYDFWETAGPSDGAVGQVSRKPSDGAVRQDPRKPSKSADSEQTGPQYNGPGWYEVSAPLEKIPVFVRAGTILPLAMPAQNTEELDYGKLTLKVYPDSDKKATYTIIDDEDGSTPAKIRLNGVVEAGRLKISVAPKIEQVTVELPVDVELQYEIVTGDEQ